MTAYFNGVLMLMLAAPLCLYSFQSSGMFAVTGPAYVGKAATNFLTFLLKTYTFPSDLSFQEGSNVCLRQCVMLSGCHSFVQMTNESVCHLLSLNRCNLNDTTLSVEKNAKTFDVITYEEGGWRNIPCFEDCITQGGCSACARRSNCYGEYCEICPYTCWHLNPLITGSTNFIFHYSFTRSVTCVQEWQLIWKHGAFYNYDEVFWSQLKLQVQVFTTNGNTFYAYYDSITMDNGNMSVGHFLTSLSTIEDGWGAPFAGRQMVCIRDTFYLPFFYDDNQFDTEEATEINITDSYSNYIWNAFTISSNNLTVSNFELYVTKN